MVRLIICIGRLCQRKAVACEFLPLFILSKNAFCHLSTVLLCCFFVCSALSLSRHTYQMGSK